MKNNDNVTRDYQIGTDPALIARLSVGDKFGRCMFLRIHFRKRVTTDVLNHSLYNYGFNDKMSSNVFSFRR